MAGTMAQHACLVEFGLVLRPLVHGTFAFFFPSDMFFDTHPAQRGVLGFMPSEIL
jgi:hypothetical protein